MSSCDWNTLKYLLLQKNGGCGESKLIHFRYPDGLLSDQELIEYKANFNSERVMLSTFKVKGSDLKLINLKSVPLWVIFFIDKDIIKERLCNDSESAKLSLFKDLAKKTYTRVKEKSQINNLFQDNNYNLKLVLQVYLEGNICYNFKFNNNLNNDTFLLAFDEICELIGKTNNNEDSEISNSIDYDFTNKWVKINNSKKR